MRAWGQRRSSSRWWVHRLLGAAIVALTLGATTGVVSLAGSAPASAQTVINGCTIVSNPTPTNFTNCPGADLGGADLSGVNLSYANLAGSSFADCSESFPGLFPPFPNVTCDETDLSGAELVDANLSNSGLTASLVVNPEDPPILGAASADLSEANLSGTDLTGAVLFQCLPDQLSFVCGGVNLTGTNVTGTLLIPPNQTVEATNTAGAVVTYPLIGGTSCSPQSGSTFPIGTSTVSCSVSDAGFFGSGGEATGTFTVTVTPVGGTATATSLSSSSNPSLVGQPVTYTATVSPAPAGGTVAFTDNGSPIMGCSAVALSGASATSSTSSGTVGGHYVVAVYSGSGTFDSSVSSTQVQTVTAATTSTSLSSSISPSVLGQLGQSVTYTATVRPAPLGGTVAFTDNGSPIAGCTAVPLSGTSASCSTTPGTPGAHNIVATYSGSVGFLESTSPSLTQVVTQVPCHALAGCNLSDLNLSDANLAGADLHGVNLLGANLSGANFSGADLGGANLAGANLSGTDLSSANLKGTNLNDVTWSNTTCSDGTNSDNDGGTCINNL